MQDARIRIVLIGIVMVAMACGGAGLYASRHSAAPPIVIAGPSIAEPSAATLNPVTAPVVAPQTTSVAPVAVPPAPPTLLYVHVAGAVRQPSLYQLPPNSRVMHAIKAAGGPTSKADLDAINLAEKIHDGEKIYVPTKAAAQKVVVAANAPMTVETSAPTVAPVFVASRAKPGKSAAGSGKPGKLVSPSQGRVNINTAGAQQLEELPGIGPAMAGRILGYRQQAGGFQKAEDLMNVGGIGQKKFARMAPLVKLH